MADDDDRISSTCEHGADVVDGRSRREPIVGLGLDVQRPGQLAARFACPQERAREDRLGPGQFVPHALTQIPRLLASFGSQRPKIVRLSRRGFRVTHEVQAHLA